MPFRSVFRSVLRVVPWCVVSAPALSPSLFGNSPWGIRNSNSEVTAPCTILPTNTRRLKPSERAPGVYSLGYDRLLTGVHVLVEHAQRQHGHRRVKEVVRGYKEDIVDGLKQGGGRADGRRALLPTAGDAEESPVGPRGTGHSSCSVRRDTTHLRAEPAATVRSVTPSGGGKLSGL